MSEAGTARDFLAGGPKRRVSLKGARRRSWMARGLRLAFFLGVAAVALPVVYFMLRPEPEPAAPEPTAETAAAETGVVTMTNPRFTGEDSDGRPFQILAQTMTRRPTDEANITTLEVCSFLDNAAEGAVDTTRVEALQCVYNSESQILELQTGVDLVTDDGYALRTSRARVFMEERRAEGDAPVEVSGPFGTISADRWAFDEKSSVLHFEGNVRTVLTQQDDTAEDAGQ